ncbi:radical SAM/SPASM domain-containing protein [Thermotoga profunda]|uniref:radical SAM/SPASM domain-containing protein n=1 Tax=Thermotoga profunda TaxID=1508420 RepID=UPI0005973842|nr:radical SAM protein [Thermotoga profunda]
MIKESYYNFRVKTNNGELLLYNTKTGAVALLNKKLSHELFRLLEGRQDFPSEFLSSLKNEGFLVSEEDDEISEIRSWHLKHINDPRFIHLTLLPAETCNFACPYCFQYRRRNKFMKPEVYEAILNLVEKLAVENSKRGDQTFLRISWFGGEPLLSIQGITYFHKKLEILCQKLPIKTSCSIVTNGYLLSNDVAKKLIELGITDFQITLDGDESSHDKLRVLRNGSPTFQTIYQNLINISNTDLNFKVAIRVNFIKTSIESAKNLLQKFVKDLGNDSRFIIYFRPVYHFETSRNGIQCLLKDIFDLENGLKQQLQFTLKVLEMLAPLRQEVNWLSPYGKALEILPAPTPCWCQAERRYSYIIGADGLLFPCDTFVGSKNHSIGSLLPNGEMVYNEKILQKWKSSIFDDPDRYSNCLKCKLLPICMGGCKRVRLSSGNTVCYLKEKDILFTMCKYTEILEDRISSPKEVG